MKSDNYERSRGPVAIRSQTNNVLVIILILFFLSGACGLVYEVVWMRMLTLVFGATAFATSTILASFFAGLALGSFYFGRFIDQERNPLRAYALLEAGIGVCAFLMPLILSGLNEVYVGISRQSGIDYFQLSLIRFTLSFLALMVPATLMGGTLPVMVKFFVTRPDRLGWNVGNLYAMNTFGAVVGTLLAGFFLILIVGVKESTYLAGVVNLLIAGTVVVLDRRIRARGAVDAGATEDMESGASEVEEELGTWDRYSSGIARLALGAVGLSGFCALALEVLWTRSLVFFLDNSTHAFTTMLTAFLLGIAIGSFVIGRVVDQRRKLLVLLGSLEVLIGVFAVVAIPVLSGSTPVIQRMAGVSRDSMLLLYWQWTGMRFLTSLSVMLVPTVLFGMTFPLVSKIYTRSAGMVGTALGHVYSVNTIGGVLGSVVAGFILVPLIGVQNGITVIAAVNIVIGGTLIIYEPSMTGRMRWVAAGVSGLLLVSLGTLHRLFGELTSTSYYERMETAEILSYDEGIGATVKVFADTVGDKFLSIDGFPVAGTSLGMQGIQKPLGHLPLLLSNVPSPRVNIIGFGAGGTSWGVMQYDVELVHCVELVPAVIRAAQWFPEINHGVLTQPRFNVIMGDGRNYALVTDETYDVISIDATSPKMAGNGSLYTLEFYQLLKERLSDQGLLVQWLPLHLLSDREVRMTARTFLTVFPHTTLWYTPFRHHGILVGTQEPLKIDYPSLTRKLERTGVQQDLAQMNVTGPMDFLSWFVMGEEALTEYTGDADLNTDDHPYLEFAPAMAYFVAKQYHVRNILNTSRHRESVGPFLANAGQTEEEIRAVAGRLERRFEATEHSIRGDIFESLGMQREALLEYSRALSIDADEKNWLSTRGLYQ